jgi:hypothetical protein
MVFEDVGRNGRKEFNRKSILRKSYILSIKKIMKIFGKPLTRCALELAEKDSSCFFFFNVTE